jgi:hypothetical protein
MEQGTKAKMELGQWLYLKGKQPRLVKVVAAAT